MMRVDFERGVERLDGNLLVAQPPSRFCTQDKMCWSGERRHSASAISEKKCFLRILLQLMRSRRATLTLRGVRRSREAVDPSHQYQRARSLQIHQDAVVRLDEN